MKIPVAIAAVLLAVSCDHPQEPLHAVYAIDLSASIEARALEAAFEAASDSLRSLDRGDEAAVIPIVGDDLNEVQGRIFRYRLGSDRQPYDGDLRRLAAEEKQALTELREAALRKPSAHTDLLGALDLVAEELDVGPKNGIRVLVLLSDFLHDDARYRFAVDPALADSKAAGAFARQLASRRPLRLDGVRVFLGALTSRDLARLPSRRREALRAFWTTYLRELGAEVRWATDGTGMLGAFLMQARSPAADGGDPNDTAAHGTLLAELWNVDLRAIFGSTRDDKARGVPCP